LKVLLDEDVPAKMARFLPRHKIHTLVSMQWGGIKNGELLIPIERERFEAMPEETVRPRPLITNREPIAASYKPGAGFREMLRVVEDAQLERAIRTAAGR
jgi:poly(A) polymerase